MPRWKRRSIRQDILEDSYDLSDEGDGPCDIQQNVCYYIENQDVTQLRNLFDSGVDLNFSNKFGEGPLHLAVAQEANEAGIEILDLLLYFGSSTTKQDRFGETPLHKAASKSAIYVQKLLDAGAPVNARDNAGRTALMLACGTCSETSLMIVQYLMDRGATVHYKDGDGQTALHYICRQHNSSQSEVKAEIAYKLMYVGLDVNCRDHAGYSAPIYGYIGPKIMANFDPSADHTQLLNALMRGGGNCLKDLLVSIQRKNRSAVREFMIFVSGNYWIFEHVTSTEILRRLKKVVLQHGAIDSQNERVSLFLEFLRNSLRKPRTLKEIARFVIRDKLEGKVLLNAEKLGLPQTLQDYVTFSELQMIPVKV